MNNKEAIEVIKYNINIVESELTEKCRIMKEMINNAELREVLDNA